MDAYAWSRLCILLQSHSFSMAMLCPGLAAELIGQVTSRFSNQSAPNNAMELEIRTIQERVTSSLISDIAHAHSMASIQKGAAVAIFEEVKKLCSYPMPVSKEGADELRANALICNRRISSLCHEENMRRIHR